MRIRKKTIDAISKQIRTHHGMFGNGVNGIAIETVSKHVAIETISDQTVKRALALGTCLNAAAGSAPLRQVLAGGTRERARKVPLRWALPPGREVRLHRRGGGRLRARPRAQSLLR